MNERIQKLAQQTDIWCDQNYAESEHYDLRWEEKFAELIIRDCLSVIEQRKGWIDNKNESHSAQWIYGYEKAVNHCSMFVKEHFGVEE